MKISHHLKAYIDELFYWLDPAPGEHLSGWLNINWLLVRNLFGLLLFYGLSFVGLTLALKRIDVSVAYAIWSGLGTALIAVIGVTYFHESVTPVKLGSLALIILGVIGLNLGGGH